MGVYCVLNTIDTDALVLKHQYISINSVDQISIALGFRQKYYIHREQ